MLVEHLFNSAALQACSLVFATGSVVPVQYNVGFSVVGITVRRREGNVGT